MATSGTYNFNPSLGEIVLYAYNLCGLRNTSLLQEHMESARMASNMLCARWANQGVNLWKVDLVTVNLNQTPATLSASGNGSTATITYSGVGSPVFKVGSQISISGMSPSGYNGSYTVTGSAVGAVSFESVQTGSMTSPGTITPQTPMATYSVSPNTVMVLDAYVTTDQTGGNIDRIIMPVSRTEYASYPNKEQEGFPTVFWFDRLLSPTITLWPVPNADTGPSTLSYYRVTQIQDSALNNGTSVDIPYLWLEAFAYGLAQRLAMVWAPDKIVMLKPLADEAYQIAADQNIETAQQYISPMISGYFR